MDQINTSSKQYFSLNPLPQASTQNQSPPASQIRDQAFQTFLRNVRNMVLPDTSESQVMLEANAMHGKPLAELEAKVNALDTNLKNLLSALPTVAGKSRPLPEINSITLHTGTASSPGWAEVQLNDGSVKCADGGHCHD